MPPGDTKPTALEPREDVTPSPAHDALKGQLLATDANLTLKKKKSWLNSLRDVVSKGALHAKAAVDSLRNDQNASKPDLKAALDTQGNTEPLSRQSTDSVTSQIPSKSHNEQQHTLRSKATISSLREHLPRRTGGHGGHKRGSIHSISSRRSCETPAVASLERFVSPTQVVDGTPHHRRSASVEGSLFGSIRRLGRKTVMAKPPILAEDQSYKESAADVPLPSSPIDIPASAPALELDLGPTGFMSASQFVGAPGKRPTRETLNLTNPANKTTGLPARQHMAIVEESNPKLCDARPEKSIVPSNLPNVHTRDIIINPDSGPATPMPGTNLRLEIDGANECASSDRSLVFERSVTPPSDKERKEIRTMRSLDAMTEVCTITQETNDVVQAQKSYNGTRLALIPPSSNTNHSQCETTSTSTIDICTSEMPELTRQQNQDKQGPVVLTTVHNGDDFRNDPIAPIQINKSGPPSPTRNVNLPFRPKRSLDNAEAAVCPVNESKFAKERSAYEGENQTYTSVSTTSTSHLATTIVSTHCEPAHLGTNVVVEDESGVYELLDTAKANMARGSDDDTQSRVDQLLADNLFMPEYESIISSGDCSTDGMSLNGGPLIPMAPFYAGNDDSPGPSPSRRNVRSRVGGEGSADYEFCFDNWLKSSSSALIPNSADIPYRGCITLDTNNDSGLTSEDRNAPPTSSASKDPDRMPSMGNRLKFDLKRSQRNRRYNALHQTLPVAEGNKDQSPLRHPLRFTVGGSEETEAYELQLADFESAYASSQEGASQKVSPQKNSQVRVGSEESIGNSLKDAVSNVNLLRERLGELPYDEYPVVAQTDDPEPTASLLSTKDATNTKDRAIRSRCPSPEKRAPDKQPATMNHRDIA